MIRKAARLPLMLALLFFLGSSVRAEISILNEIYFGATPHGSFQGGPLDYVFQATAEASVLRYSSPRESLFPFILYGAIENKHVLLGFFNFWTTAADCGQTGVIREAYMVCNMWTRALCPAADGWWRANNRTRGGFTDVWVKVSPRYRAQCIDDFPGPGGPCAVAPAAATVTMNLESGAVRRYDTPEHARLALDRQEEKDGMFYTFERWSLNQPADRPPIQARGRGLRARRSDLTSPDELRIDVPALPDGHVTTPSVEFGKRRSSVRIEPGERILVRAEFSPAGSLDEVKTLRGSPVSGGRLAEDLSIEAHDAGHRTVVYALFERSPQDGSSDLVSSVSVLPRCCCGSIVCQ